ncbi:MAG: hypothetical protein COA50_10185 [Flavobacteriaceae bacterium]|nr:MAG: hypothetical protein COA50_10185 [Flavobacteriaceae bacterium]
MKTNYYVPCMMLLLSVTGSFSQNPDKTDLESRKVLCINAPINTEHFDGFPMVMPNGLTLYFSSDRPGGEGDLDIYVSYRNSLNEAWQKPINLGTAINSPGSDHSVAISKDGHYMYFTSDMEGGEGVEDLYISYREDITTDINWSVAKNLGKEINTKSLEACPLYHVENNRTELYFVSDRKSGWGGMDLYYSLWNEKEKIFGTPIHLKVSSTENDMHFEPERGLIWSSRKGGVGKQDIWIANFNEEKEEWENAECLKYPINTVYDEGMPSIVKDFSELYFHSNRPEGVGSFDIYIATNN